MSRHIDADAEWILGKAKAAAALAADPCSSFCLWRRCGGAMATASPKTRVAFGGVCVAFVAFALPKRHALKALQHKALWRVWRLWRLFFSPWILKKK